MRIWKKQTRELYLRGWNDFQWDEGVLNVEKKEVFKEDEYKKIYDNIGGNPTYLMDLLESYNMTNSIDVCIENMSISARGSLKAFELKPIIKALKKHPEGVAVEDFEGQLYNGISLAEPKKVGDAMKLRHSIVYRIDLKPVFYQYLPFTRLP